VAGGDVSEAYVLELADGRRVFAKTRRDAPEGMFEAEARGLEWLRSAFEDGDAATALTIPRVLAVGPSPTRAFLVLELLEPGRRAPDFDEHLGRGLARLHRAGAPRFGFEQDNFIGPLPQSNRPAATWAEFYRSERLLPQLSMPNARRLLAGDVRRRFDRLLDALERWVGEEEPPARLHGDLWGGNLHVSPRGTPALIDPAVYGGHREMDLAMMRLFGGFTERTFRCSVASAGAVAVTSRPWLEPSLALCPEGAVPSVLLRGALAQGEAGRLPVEALTGRHHHHVVAPVRRRELGGEPATRSVLAAQA